MVVSALSDTTSWDTLSLFTSKGDIRKKRITARATPNTTRNHFKKFLFKNIERRVSLNSSVKICITVRVIYYVTKVIYFFEN